MAVLTRRSAIQGGTAVAVSSLGFSLLPQTAFAQSVSVLRQATRYLAQACLEAAAYQAFSNWEGSAGFVQNAAAIQNRTFHDRYSHPAMYQQNFSMVGTRTGKYMGVQNLPQTNSEAIFTHQADFNAAECMEVGDTLTRGGILPIAKSSPREPVLDAGWEFMQRIQADSNSLISPYDVADLYYVRDFCGCTGRPLRGWGYALKSQPQVGRFRIYNV